MFKQVLVALTLALTLVFTPYLADVSYAAPNSKGKTELDCKATTKETGCKVKATFELGSDFWLAPDQVGGNVKVTDKEQGAGFTITWAW